VISRPRITFNEQEEDEIDSDEEWDFSVPQKSSRDSSVFERAVNPIRSLVSRQKKRFVNSRYDLDLSYITGNIIAMGYPSEGAESVYRNKMSSVQSFLEDYHKRKYKVYNLCSERAYPAVKFKNRVGYFPFDDHRCPTLTLVELFCRDVYQWLKGHEDNVAVVHCKAGKGRTGCLICCYIVYAKLCETARDAIEFFGAQRTHDGKGVTIPSQLRYIHYTEKIVSSEDLSFCDAPQRVLVQVIMITIPSFDPTGGCSE
jgi:phosphatidylinositol-3,4,5-trisphosphate 3-phosphatase/dual-specificity protein phosphatase PTEN